MKKIVPFNNVLTFSTDVCEISAISLEHDIKTECDSITGTFYITGEYKITEGQLEKEKFNFELPFDIALGCKYDLDTLKIDIDDFRYELVGRNELKVNIDLYIDGEIVQKQPEELTLEIEPIEIKDTLVEEENREEEPNDDILNDMLETTKEDEIVENNENVNNIFNSNTFHDQYVTYKVYRVEEGDTIDKIIEKYNTTKEELSKYNNIDEIHPKDKLIIPYNDK